MRGYAWHLEFENLVIPIDRIFEPMFPMHSNFGHAVLIPEKETAVAVNHYLWQVIGSVLQNVLEHLIDINSSNTFSV